MQNDKCRRPTGIAMPTATAPLQDWKDAALLRDLDPAVRVFLWSCSAVSDTSASCTCYQATTSDYACACHTNLLRGCAFACIHLQQVLHAVLGSITDLGPWLTLEVQLALQHLQAHTEFY
jgi:hypothetical protein